MTELIVKLILCHMVGDYVLQSDFIAKTKGENWYHMVVHCALYCVPFAVLFGITWQLAFLFGVHILIDALKARWNVVSYQVDQICHFVAMISYLA